MIITKRYFQESKSESMEFRLQFKSTAKRLTRSIFNI